MDITNLFVSPSYRDGEMLILELLDPDAAASIGGVKMSSNLCSRAFNPPIPITPSTAGVMQMHAKSISTGYNRIESSVFPRFVTADKDELKPLVQTISGIINILDTEHGLNGISISNITGFLDFFRSVNISCRAAVELGRVMRGNGAPVSPTPPIKSELLLSPNKVKFKWQLQIHKNILDN